MICFEAELRVSEKIARSSAKARQSIIRFVLLHPSLIPFSTTSFCNNNNNNNSDDDDDDDDDLRTYYVLAHTSWCTDYVSCNVVGFYVIQS